MSIVSRYLLGQFIGASAMVFVLLCITWLSADALLHMDELGEDGVKAVRALFSGALEFAPLAMPLSCLVGIVWSLTRAVRHLEITAIRCGGIPLRRALTPLLVACLLLGGILALVEDRVFVPARESLHALEAGNIGLLDRPRNWEDRWWFSTGGSIFSASRYEMEPFTLHDVTVFEFDAEHELRRRIDAVQAQHGGGVTWTFQALTVRTFGGAAGMRVERRDGDQIDLGVTGDDLARAIPSANAISLHQLVRRIRAGVGDSNALAALETALHERIAQPISILLLVLLAIPYAIGDGDRGDSLARALLLAIGVAAAFFLAWSIAIFSARSGVLPPPLPIWGVTLLFLTAGIWRFRRISE